ncbi:hypothetical protein CDL15_Pgr003378 [Punica granatum]|uniref:Uncharacterized protein n=1 Tax=Punica granatum TaxID=22663 RepID=A0A218X3A9_PUNGR|nr:hypothetical protein CDL15_Pgr003378 [Punica granatum]
MDLSGENEVSMLGNDAHGLVNYDSLGDVVGEYDGTLLNNQQPIQYAMKGFQGSGFNNRCAVDQSDHVMASGPQGWPINMQPIQYAMKGFQGSGFNNRCAVDQSDHVMASDPQGWPINMQFDNNPTPDSFHNAKRIRALEQAIEEINTQMRVRVEDISTGTTSFNNCGPSAAPVNNPHMLPSGHQYQEPLPYSNILTYPNNMAGSSGKTSKLNPDPPTPTANSNRGVIHIQTWTSSKIYLQVGDGVAYIGICTLIKSGLLPAICAVLEINDIALLSVKSSSQGSWKTFFLKVQTSGPTLEQMQNGVTAVQLYKEAADEIALIV